jgi:hypothetical protein
MAEPKQPKRKPEHRVFDSALESIPGMRLVPQKARRSEGESLQLVEQLELEPPQPEIVSRLINRIKKI